MGGVADKLVALLQTLIPCEVRRAEWRLLSGDARPDDLKSLLQFHQDTVAYVSAMFAFSVPSSAALAAIARHARHGIVEVGAGNGLWAKLLRDQCGLVVEASDSVSSEQPLCFGDVLIGDSQAQAASAPSSHALFLCWPALELEAPPSNAHHVPDDEANLMAVRALDAYRGDTLLYVGEWRGRSGLISQLSWRTAACGQTAGARFQSRVEAGWELRELVPLPRWPGFADALYIFQRATKPALSERHAVPSAEEQPRAVEPARLPPACLRDRFRAMLAAGLDQPAALAAAILLTRL